MYLEFKSFSFIFKWAPDNSSKVLDSITGDRRSRDESRRQLPEQAAFHGVSFLSLTLAVCDSTHLHHPASFSRCLSLLLSPSSNCMSNQCSPVQSSTKTFSPFSAPALSFFLSFFFIYIFWFSRPPPPPLWCSPPHIHSPSLPLYPRPLLLPLSSVFLLLRCAASADLSAPSLLCR